MGRTKAVSELQKRKIALRIAETDYAFLSASTLPIVSMMVAVTVAAVALELPSEGTAGLSATGAILTLWGFLAIWARPNAARKVVEAEERVAELVKGASVGKSSARPGKPSPQSKQPPMWKTWPGRGTFGALVLLALLALALGLEVCGRL